MIYFCYVVFGWVCINTFLSIVQGYLNKDHEKVKSKCGKVQDVSFDLVGRHEFSRLWVSACFAKAVPDREVTPDINWFSAYNADFWPSWQACESPETAVEMSR